MNREYPDEPAGPFPRPPRTITDAEGREIHVAVVDPADKQALLEMYRDFDPADRAQGIPPAREDAIDRWLDTVLGEDCVNVVATEPAAGGAVGHATLVPESEDYELAIFVLSDYQGAGIGSAVLETLLGHARELGIEYVWLTVERWNDAAIALYRSVGFEQTDGQRLELEMTLRL
jgi:GNAT superfamily N-acetyltransferase